MYNGIGLNTVRGSATSGYVSKNLSYVRPEQFRNKLDHNRGNPKFGSRNGPSGPKINPEILDHNQKRAIEGKVYELRVKLEEEGVEADVIEAKCANHRSMLESGNITSSSLSSNFRTTDTHSTAAAKERDNAKARSAFGIRDDFVEGDSFDASKQRSLLETKRANAIADQVKEKPEARRFLDRGGTDRSRTGGKETEKYVPRDRSPNRENSRSRSRDRGGRRRYAPIDRSPNRGRSRSRSRDRGDRGDRRKYIPVDRSPNRGRSRSRDRSVRDGNRTSGDVRREPVEVETGEILETDAPEPTTQVTATVPTREEYERNIEQLGSSKRKKRSSSSSSDSSSDGTNSSGSSDSGKDQRKQKSKSSKN